jgi:hypothetical protein
MTLVWYLECKPSVVDENIDMAVARSDIIVEPLDTVGLGNIHQTQVDADIGGVVGTDFTSYLVDRGLAELLLASTQHYARIVCKFMAAVEAMMVVDGDEARRRYCE